MEINSATAQFPFPYNRRIPKLAGILIFYWMFFPLFFMGSTYVGSLNEITASTGELMENFQLINLCAYIGMALVFPIMMPYLHVRNVRLVYVVGFLILAALNLICARLESPLAMLICAVAMGIARMFIVLNTTFAMSTYFTGMPVVNFFSLKELPKPEMQYRMDHMRAWFFPCLYGYIFCIVQLGNFFSSLVATDLNWADYYYIVAGMMIFTSILVYFVMPAYKSEGKYTFPSSRLVDMALGAVSLAGFCYLMFFGKTFDWFGSDYIRIAMIITLIAGALFILLQLHSGNHRYLELGIFRYRNTWIGVLLFVLVMFVNTPSQLFIGSFAKIGSVSGNIEVQALMKYAIYGCLFGVAISLVMIIRRMKFRTIFVLGFLLMTVSNIYMYFQYQTDAYIPNLHWPMLLNYMGWIMPYSVVCAHGMKNLPTKYLPTWLFLIVAVRNVIAPAVGSSVYSNWLQERQQFHITELTGNIDVTNHAASNVFSGTMKMAKGKGSGELEAKQLATATLSAKVRQQATIVAMKDITATTIWICIGCVLICLFLPYHRDEKT